MTTHEEDEAYDHAVARLGERDRLIAEADGVQWIWQHWSGSRWRARMFFRSRAGIALHMKHLPGVEQVLADLPEWFPEPREARWSRIHRARLG